MKTKLLIIILFFAAILAPLYGDTFIDTFSGSTLDPFWTVVDEPNNYASGGGFLKAADHLRFNSVYTTAYAYIRTTDTIDTTAGVRADAIMRQDHYGASTWGMSVTVYYNAGNWVSLRIASANGQQGLMKDIMLNGVRSSQMTTPAVDLRWYFLITGVELTDTQIKFYSSTINPPQSYFGETNIDYWSSEISAFTMARPANFTGPALVFIGKGFSGDGAPKPYFQNNQTSEPLPYGSPGFAGIDYARVTYTPFEYLPMDFNEDYKVDFNDFAAFAMAWGQCSEPNDSDCDKYWKPDTFELWEIDPYINIVKTQSPPSSDRLSDISMQMAKNEYRDFVFMVSNNSPTYDDVNVAVTVQPLGSLPSNAILVEQTMYTKNRSSTDTADAVYPLTGSVVIPAGESRQFRLRFDSRFSGISAGNYSYNVLISDSLGGQTKTLPGTLQVWNIQLPSYDILPNNTWAELLNVELGQPAVLPSAVAEMKKYGLNQVFIVPTETPNATDVDNNGNILTFDTTAFDARVSAVKSAWDGTSGTDKLQWIISLSGKINSVPSLGMTRTDIVFPSALWQTVYGQYLSQLKARFAYHGIAVADWKLVFADEATVAVLEGLEIPVAEITKAKDSSIKLACNSSYRPSAGWDARYLAAFDVFQPQFEAMVANPSTLAWLKTSGKPIWTYDYQGDMSQVGKNVYDYYRVRAWNLLKYGYSGIGLWTYSAQGGGANSVWNYQTPCYWLAFKHYANDDVVHARRYEMYREGSDDYRYVAALRTIAAAKGKTTEAELLIQDAVNNITADVNDTSRCEYWRLQIAQRIQTYQSLP